MVICCDTTCTERLEDFLILEAFSYLRDGVFGNRPRNVYTVVLSSSSDILRTVERSGVHLDRSLSHVVVGIEVDVVVNDSLQRYVLSVGEDILTEVSSEDSSLERLDFVELSSVESQLLVTSVNVYGVTLSGVLTEVANLHGHLSSLTSLNSLRSLHRSNEVVLEHVEDHDVVNQHAARLHEVTADVRHDVALVSVVLQRNLTSLPSLALRHVEDILLTVLQVNDDISVVSIIVGLVVEDDNGVHSAVGSRELTVSHADPRVSIDSLHHNTCSVVIGRLLREVHARIIGVRIVREEVCQRTCEGVTGVALDERQREGLTDIHRTSSTILILTTSVTREDIPVVENVLTRLGSVSELSACLCIDRVNLVNKFQSSGIFIIDSAVNLIVGLLGKNESTVHTLCSLSPLHAHLVGSRVQCLGHINRSRNVEADECRNGLTLHTAVLTDERNHLIDVNTIGQALSVNERSLSTGSNSNLADNNLVAEHLCLHIALDILIAHVLGRSNERNGSLCLTLCIGSDGQVLYSQRRCGLETSINRDVRNLDSVHVSLTDSVDTEVVLASLLDADDLISVLFFSVGQVGRLNDGRRHSLCSSSSTHLHFHSLRTPEFRSVFSNGSECIALASLQANRRSDEPVVSNVGRMPPALEQVVRSIEAPCAAVVVSINDGEQLRRG